MKTLLEAPRQSLAVNPIAERKLWTERASSVGTLLASGLCFLAAACGSGTAALFGSNDSGSSNTIPPPRLTLSSTVPSADDSIAFPSESIRLVFSASVDPNSAMAPGAFSIYESDPALGAPDLYDQIVEEVKCSPTDASLIRLELFEPLKLQQMYFVEIAAGAIQPVDTSIVPFEGGIFEFQIRSGALRQEELVSFLNPARRLFYRSPFSRIPGSSSVDAIAVLEGIETSSSSGSAGDFVIAVTVLQDSGLIQDPTRIFRESDPTGESQTRLGNQAVGATGLTSIAFSGGGKSFCSNSNAPKKHVYVSQFNRSTPGWEILQSESSGQSDKLDFNLDASSGERWLSWPPEVANLAAGFVGNNAADDSVVTWWGWTNFNGASMDYDDWDVWAVSRAEGSAWTAPQRLNVDAMGNALGGVSGYPFLLENHNLTELFVLWPQAASRLDLLGKNDSDQDGVIPDAEVFSTNNNDACFGSNTGAIVDATLDDETIDAFAFCSYSNGQFSDPIELVLPGQKLGRPTAVLLDDQARCLVLWRSADEGIVAVTADLQASSPSLSTPVPLSASFIWDELWFPCCAKFNTPFEKIIGAGVPAAALIPSIGPGDSRALVAWFEPALDGTEPTAALRVVEFDLAAGIWDASTEAEVVVIDSLLDAVPGSFLLNSLSLDDAGNAYLSWSVKEVPSDGSDVSSKIFAARRAVNTSVWCEVVNPNPQNSKFQINKNTQCVNTSGTELGGWSDVHPSGQVLFSWTNEECDEQVNSSTILRRFK